MKHVADVLALVGVVALIWAGFTVNVTAGLIVAGVLAIAAAVVVAKTSKPVEVDGA